MTLPAEVKVAGWPPIEVNSVGHVVTLGFQQPVTELAFYADEVDDLIGALSVAKHAIPAVPRFDEPLSDLMRREVSNIQQVDEDEAYDLIDNAIEAETAVYLRYTKEDGEVTSRVVSPYELRRVQRLPYWTPKHYVVGYDHRRDAIRNFRIDRIQAMRPALAGFVPEGTAS